MATFSQNQVKDIFIANAFATETTAKEFVATASPLELQVLKADGSGVPTGVEDFYFIQKHADGSIKRSDILPANQIRFINPVSPKVPVLKSYAITIDTTNFVNNDILQIQIVLDHWGSRSFEDQYFKYAQYQWTTGTSAADTAAGLVLSLTRNFSREPNTLFTFAVNGNDVVITEVAQPFVTGKKQGLPLEFVVSNNFSGVQAVTQRVMNPCSGQRVRDLEYFCKGNVGDSYRYAGYPHNFEQWFDSDLDAEYCLFDIGFWYEGVNHAIQTSEKEIIVALVDCTGSGTLTALLEIATGLSLDTPGVPRTTTTTTKAPTTTTTTEAPTTTTTTTVLG